VYFESVGRFVHCPVYERGNLAAGTELAGPAIVEQLDCTTVVHIGQQLAVDDWGNLTIQMEA
jgi:N-methylhydantoinase A